ncbi:adenylate kinase [Fusarium oxysporum f. sp. raphani]|uniref:Adenylate kinase n=1 Tax=Fusarium oxysporum f. sp. raphani TaxID=96318 RepID=A0A8J5PV36_FUSOX|nr:adenylate kinase [Fusarium oxysporum f. sp. raphani]
MQSRANLCEHNRSFAIVFVVGAPGAGKGTLSTHLAQAYNLVHYSVGDGLRAWMRENPSTALAVEIQSKLDNQGFVTSETLNLFIYLEILNTINDKPGVAGILIDGYPRCMEQLESFGSWPFQGTLPLAPGNDGGLRLEIKPDLVLSFEVTKQNAKERYLGRARDTNDTAHKFERCFAEYEVETTPVKEAYQQRGILISADGNGNKEENVEALTKKLKESGLWRKIIEERTTGTQFLI